MSLLIADSYDREASFPWRQPSWICAEAGSALGRVSPSMGGTQAFSFLASPLLLALLPAGLLLSTYYLVPITSAYLCVVIVLSLVNCTLYKDYSERQTISTKKRVPRHTLPSVPEGG